MTKPKKTLKTKQPPKVKARIIAAPVAIPTVAAIEEIEPGILEAEIHVPSEHFDELQQHKEDPKTFLQKLFAWLNT